jgi:hypothetical protein
LTYAAATNVADSMLESLGTLRSQALFLGLIRWICRDCSANLH